MTTNLRLLFATAVIALLTSGCGPKDKTATGTTAATPQDSSSTAAAPATSGPRTVEITAGDNMKFNVTSIEAKAGEQLTVILTNIGTQPKEVMGHNWILLKKGTDADAFDKAAAQAVASEYFPAAMADQVVAHIPLLGPRKSGQVTFAVPSEPGEYTFLCSYPAHYQTGMKGVLVVK